MGPGIPLPITVLSQTISPPHGDDWNVAKYDFTYSLLGA